MKSLTIFCVTSICLLFSFESFAESDLKIKGSKQLKKYVSAHVGEVVQYLRKNEDAGKSTFVRLKTLRCLGVRAEDAGDVSYPEDGVFGTCLARTYLGYADSEDTIISITVDGEKNITAKILAQQL